MARNRLCLFHTYLTCSCILESPCLKMVAGALKRQVYALSKYQLAVSLKEQPTVNFIQGSMLKCSDILISPLQGSHF